MAPPGRPRAPRDLRIHPCWSLCFTICVHIPLRRQLSKVSFPHGLLGANEASIFWWRRVSPFQTQCGGAP
eukprot:5001581-Pyramimonas_sp.AAC.1